MHQEPHQLYLFDTSEMESGKQPLAIHCNEWPFNMAPHTFSDQCGPSTHVPLPYTWPVHAAHPTRGLSTWPVIYLALPSTWSLNAAPHTRGLSMQPIIHMALQRGRTLKYCPTCGFVGLGKPFTAGVAASPGYRRCKTSPACLQRNHG